MRRWWPSGVWVRGHGGVMDLLAASGSVPVTLRPCQVNNTERKHAPWVAWRKEGRVICLCLLFWFRKVRVQNDFFASWANARKVLHRVAEGWKRRQMGNFWASLILDAQALLDVRRKASRKLDTRGVRDVLYCVADTARAVHYKSKSRKSKSACSRLARKKYFLNACFRPGVNQYDLWVKDHSSFYPSWYQSRLGQRYKSRFKMPESRSWHKKVRNSRRNAIERSDSIRPLTILNS